MGYRLRNEEECPEVAYWPDIYSLPHAEEEERNQGEECLHDADGAHQMEREVHPSHKCAFQEKGPSLVG